MTLPLILAGGVAYVAYNEVSNRLERRDKLIGRMAKKRKKLKQRREYFKSLMSGKNQDSALVYASDAKGRRRIDLSKDTPKLEIVNEHGDTVLALGEIPNPRRTAWKDVHGSDHPISRLNPLFSAVPTVGLAGSVANCGYYIVESSGPLMNASSGGFRGMVRDSKGIREHATLHKADQLSSLVNMAALWQIASVILTQKHLHDISKTLKSIESGVREVIRHQKGERKSKILGAVEDFMEIYDEIGAGSFRRASESVIDSPLRELRQVGNHLKEELEVKLFDLRNVRDFDFWKNSTLEEIQIVIDLLHQIHLCIAARLYGCIVLAIASAAPEELSIRIRNIRNDHKEQFVGNICRVFGIIESQFHSGEVAFWNDFSKVQNVIESIDEVLPRAKLEQSVKSFQKTGAMLEMIVKQRSQPEPILVKVSDDKIVGYSFS
ncbi:MAG: hypothetical protein OXI95_09305 [bacterium]|nr:hypothetical protein [bacterium]